MMWWESTKLAAKSIWSWCKKYWQIVVGFVSALILFILTRKTPDPRKVLEKSNEAHRKEVDALKKAHESELAARSAALERQKETMAAVEVAFEKASQDLTRKKRKEIIKIIKENDGDPNAITEKLSELTGFKIKDS